MIRISFGQVVTPVMCKVKSLIIFLFTTLAIGSGCKREIKELFVCIIHKLFISSDSAITFNSSAFSLDGFFICFEI